jgi:Skp family chaperone for outer membrane proteins
MTSNQRRPGFRLPWTSDEEAAAAAGAEAGANGNGPADHGDAAEAAVAPAATEAAAATTAPRAPTDAPTAAAPHEAPAGFMRDLVSAMRRVAEENRQASLADLRTKSENRVRALEGETEERALALRERAESDIAGVGDWSRSEVARIEQEAEQRVVARRAQLDQQLAAETTRSEGEVQALRRRVAAYEQELDAYHARLSDIADPAAFAAAAKTMPPQPKLDAPSAVAAPAPKPVAPPLAVASASPDVEDVQEPTETAEADREEAAAPETAATDDAQAPEASAPAEPAEPTPAPEPAAVAAAAPQATATAAPAAAGVASQGTTATEVMVKGLGSFGAITGFRQSLASVDGVDGVSLSLGPTGEFVFRAIHAPNFDIAGAIASLEGDAASIEARPEGGLRVTLDRSR